MGKYSGRVCASVWVCGVMLAMGGGSLRAESVPEVTIAGGATNIGIGSVTLQGRLTTGEVAQAYFCWGGSDGATSSTGEWEHVVSVGAVSNGVVFSATISNLLFGLEYDYRVYATNGSGSDWSTPDTFVTLSPQGPPMVPVTTGLNAHFDADKGIATDGSGVWTWQDQSANGFTATRTAGTLTLTPNQVNGLPVVHFADSTHANIAGDMFSKQQYVVFNLPNAAGDWGAVLGSQVRSGYLLNRNGSFWNGNYPSAVRQNGGVELSGNFQLSSITDYMVVRITGNDNNTSVRSGWAIGRQEGWGRLNMNLAEVISYDTALSPADEDLVGGYLAYKYGITTAYPAYEPPADVEVAATAASRVSDTTVDMGGLLKATQSVFTVQAMYSTNSHVDAEAWMADGDKVLHPLGTFTNVMDHDLVASVTGLTPDTTYYYTFMAWNAVTSLWAETAIEFTTLIQESAPPQIAALLPTNAQTGVVVSDPLVATFDESVYLIDGGVITITNLTAGSATNITLPDARISTVTSNLTIDLATDLEPATTFAILISGTAVEDIFNNGFAGIADTNTWRFTTDTRPVITGFDPTNNTSGVTLAPSLMATFDKDVFVIEGGVITLTNLTAGTAHQIALPDAQVSVSSAELTITPSGVLGIGEAYAVLIDGNAIEDAHGLNFAGISSVATWAFQTTSNATTTFIGPSSSSGDNWNKVGNWDSGIPVGTLNAVIPDGKFVTSDNQNPPAYSGNLSIGAGATLQCGYSAGGGWTYMNALGTAGSTTISMGDGSTLWMRGSYSPAVPAIVLSGDVVMILGASTSGSPTPTFSHGISGPYTVNVKGKGGASMTLDTVTNTFAGLVTDGQYGDNFNINANIAGALSGDVTISADRANEVSANLRINAADAIADTATLTLNGPDSATRVYVNADDTIGALVLDGVEQAAGTYGQLGNSNAQYQVSWLTGTGVLSVPLPPSAYWDRNGSDPGAGGSAPGGTWDAGNTYWNDLADGSGTVTAWPAGVTARFAAGSDAMGAYQVSVDGTHDIGGVAVEEGTVALAGGMLRMTSDSAMNVASGLTATISTTITNDATARSLTKTGDGTLVLGGANSFAGPMRVGGGVLVVPGMTNAGVASALGAYPAAGAGGLELAAGTLRYTGGSAGTDRGFTLKGATAALDVSTPGAALTLGNSEVLGISGALTVTGGAGSSLAVGKIRLVEGQNITLNPTTVSMTVAAGEGFTSYPNGNPTLGLGGTTDGNVVSGNLYITNPPGNPYARGIDLSKSGSGSWTVLGNFSSGGKLTVNNGTLTLAGANSYSGATTINGGTLRVNGSVNNSTITVKDGGTLGGTGTVSKAVSVASGGTVAAGDPTGTLTLGNNLTLAPGGIFGVVTVRDAVPECGGVAVSGTLDISGGTLDLDAISVPAEPCVIATYGSLTGTFTNLNMGSNWKIEYGYGGTNAIALIPPQLGAVLIVY